MNLVKVPLLVLLLVSGQAVAGDSNAKTAVGGGLGAALGTALGGVVGGRNGEVLGGAVGGGVNVVPAVRQQVLQAVQVEVGVGGDGDVKRVRRPADGGERLLRRGDPLLGQLHGERRLGRDPGDGRLADHVPRRGLRPLRSERSPACRRCADRAVDRRAWLASAAGR